jgi:hypothetical protein
MRGKSSSNTRWGMTQGNEQIEAMQGEKQTQNTKPKQMQK